ncbi:tRNA (adenosine(37)-N6)-threonylcarbamoyltransferase complex ATPase subunit type 1 TsaE [Geobacter sp.]|uniref:tRNA (adenosine(37)-N6)-threonylcarbamoyltransferase complex ATPase subunit type 1 TsaE n=1 Tax=Geobacter sp. TaxID=46610 RepID=UPI002636E9BB|nr:tRNA (adenosine(37)-N6)-threonylcarbamoyltransferase complex ATPase subunit type 1 TsaE [Geobacter sp.]
MVTILSRSVDETVLLGERLGRVLTAGTFVALYGELGSGKTHFARGVATGVGVEATVPVTSPTFTLLNEYAGRIRLYHFDLYRLAGGDDAVELGFDEYFHGEGVCLVEWAERLGNELPSERLDVTLHHVDESTRRLDFVPRGPNHEALLKKCFDRRSES